MVSLNILIMLVVGAVVGALTGKGLGGLVSNLYLAMIAGVLATIVAGFVRNTLMTRVGTEPDLSGMPMLMLIYSAVAVDRRIPAKVIMYSAIASLAGSVAAVQVAAEGEFTSPVWIGTLAGLFAGILMAILLIVYEIRPKSNP
ncbi:MAG: hypothetical protein ACREEP_13170 [Dongiaceae bacterium]